jgi:hypothetical protein
MEFWERGVFTLFWRPGSPCGTGHIADADTAAMPWRSWPLTYPPDAGPLSTEQPTTLTTTPPEWPCST